MKRTFRHFLPGMAAALLLAQAGVAQAGVNYTYTATEPATAGDWSNNFSFPQFNPALGSLDAIHLTASFDLTTSATLFNTDQASKVCWFQAGSLLSVSLPGTLGQLDAESFGPQLHYKLPGFGSASYAAFSTNVTVELTLTGAQLAPFIGTGNVELPAQAMAQEILQDLNGGGHRIEVNLSSTSGAELTLEYLDSPVPEPSSAALLGLALGGLVWKRRREQH